MPLAPRVVLAAFVLLLPAAAAADPVRLVDVQGSFLGGEYEILLDACQAPALEGIQSSCVSFEGVDYARHLWGAWATSSARASLPIVPDANLRVCFHDADAARIACHTQGVQGSIIDSPWAPVPHGAAMASVSSFIDANVEWQFVITSTVAG